MCAINCWSTGTGRLCFLYCDPGHFGAMPELRRSYVGATSGASFRSYAGATPELRRSYAGATFSALELRRSYVGATLELRWSYVWASASELRRSYVCGISGFWPKIDRKMYEKLLENVSNSVSQNSRIVQTCHTPGLGLFCRGCQTARWTTTAKTPDRLTTGLNLHYHQDIALLKPLVS